MAICTEFNAKDISYLNRDPERVIMIETDPVACSLQPENAIIVQKWKGDPQDKGLITLIPFLECICLFNPN